jgi:hypothetical protein
MHLRRELTRDGVENEPPRARVGSRQSQGERLVGAGPAGGKLREARGALIHDPGWAHPTFGTDPRGPPLWPDTRLILAPDLKALVGMLRREGLQPRGELFC